MFGLEKKAKAPFEFDLEREIKADPTKGPKLIKLADEKSTQLKGILRGGADNNMGTLLHGFTALHKVLNRIVSKK